MQTVEVRRATREDVEAFRGEPGCPPTLDAVVGLVGGQPVALAGLAFRSGRVFAFCDLKPEARRFKRLIHRTAIAIMDRARAANRRRIFAELDDAEPGARRWLERLGFEPMEGGGLWQWRV